MDVVTVDLNKLFEISGEDEEKEREIERLKPHLFCPVLPDFILSAAPLPCKLRFVFAKNGVNVTLLYDTFEFWNYHEQCFEYYIPFNYPLGEITPCKKALYYLDIGCEEAMGYILIYGYIQKLLSDEPTSMDVKTKVAHQQKKPRKNKKKPHVIRHYKVYTLNRDYEIKHRKGKHPITVECYSVIGHERHLKNGKVVFVSPHFRGKHRDEPEKYWKGVERRLFPIK